MAYMFVSRTTAAGPSSAHICDVDWSIQQWVSDVYLSRPTSEMSTANIAAPQQITM